MNNNFPKRGEIYWIQLDPTLGTEINKTRPALIVSNNSANEISKRIIVAPITSSIRKVYPFEVHIELNTQSCKILLDQIRSIDKIRVGKRITVISQDIMQKVDKALKIALALV